MLRLMTRWRPGRGGRGLIAAVLLAAIGVGFVMAPARSAPAPAAKPEGGFQTSAATAILLDPDTDSILYEKNADQPVEPASLAKLMTLEYLFNEIKHGRVKLGDLYTISENAWRKGGAPSHGSTMFAAIHSQVSVSDLIQGIIVDSANDACIAVAEALAGNETAFGQMLTKRAREIGLQNSIFTNSTGLTDPDMHVTARDMAELARYVIKTYPDLYPMFAQRDFTWDKIHQLNRNPLLGMGIGADGLKTGETKESGFSLVGSAVSDNLRLIVVVTGAKTDKDRAEEARKLLDFGFHGFKSQVLFAEGQTVGDAKVFGGDRSYVPLLGSGLIKVMVPRDSSERLSARIVYTGPIPAPISKGQTLAELKVWRGDQLALDVPLYAAESVGKGTMTQRAMDGATELIIGLLRAGVAKL